MRLTLAIVAFVASFPALSGPVVDRPEQRLDCNQESRRNIKGPGRVDVDLYRRVVERRQLYIDRKSVV
jgi:hypothetical protein